MLKSLPYDIVKKTPQKESIRIVKEFATATGDIGSLSDQDIGIIALARDYYVKQGMSEMLRKKPEQINKVIDEKALQETNFEYQDGSDSSEYSQEEQTKEIPK